MVGLVGLVGLVGRVGLVGLGVGLVGLVGLVVRLGGLVGLCVLVGVRLVVTGNLVVFFLSPKTGALTSSERRERQDKELSHIVPLYIHEWLYLRPFHGENEVNVAKK